MSKIVDLNREKTAKTLQMILEKFDVQKFVLLSLDRDGKASVNIDGTNMMENCFLAQVLDDVIKKVLNGETLDKIGE